MEMKTQKLRIKSYAKINLFLDVLRKREDGFHDIRSIFSEIELFDKINFILTKKDDVSILTNKDFVSVKNNLIYRVAIIIKNKYNVSSGVKVELEKNIPIAAGLGGGSSNAAATIIALSQLWELNLSKKEMHAIASELGSDINFFLEGECQMGVGRGEQVSPLPGINLDHIFLVNPGFAISSKEAYQAVTPNNEPHKGWQNLLYSSNSRYCFNALEKEICHLYPQIKEIIDYLKNNGADKAILSGSGATVIAFCPDANTARKFADFFSAKNYWSYITKTKRSTR